MQKIAEPDFFKTLQHRFYAAWNACLQCKECQRDEDRCAHTNQVNEQHGA
jgi:hypothetical protein